MAREPDTSVVNRLADDLVAGRFTPVGEFFEKHGVAAPLVAWEPAVGGMASKSFDFLIGFWARSRVNGSWPPEGVIDPVELRPALGNLLVCEPLEDLSDFRIRLYGSRLALDMGRDLTGSHVSDVNPSSYITAFYLASYRAVALRGAPLYTRHAPSAKSFASEIKRLLLPFGPATAVNRILVGVGSVPRRPLGRPNWAKTR